MWLIISDQIQKAIHTHFLKLFLLLIVIGLSGCSWFNGSPNTSNPPTVTTTIHGTAKDEFNNVLSGVAININGHSTTSDVQGNFNIPALSVSPDHCVILCKKAGYFNAAVSQSPISNGITEISVSMMAASVNQSFSSQSGGSVVLTKGKIDFQPGEFIKKDESTYSGQVSAALRYLTPDDSNFFQFFSGDPTSNKSDGSLTSLVPYGIFRTQINGGSGEELGIAKGNSAILTFAISSDMLANAPAQIPLWYFDENSLTWKEEGSAQLIGTNYVGKVSHFTDWMCAEASATTAGYSPNFEFSSNAIWSISANGAFIPILTPSTDGSDNPCDIYDANTGSYKHTQHSGGSLGNCSNNIIFQVSGDVNHILEGCFNGSLYYWDVNISIGDPLKTYKCSGHGAVSGTPIKMLPDGINAVYANPDDTEIVLLRLSDSTVIRKLGFIYTSGGVSTPNIIGISSDGSQMLINEAQNYGLWDINNGTKINTFIINDGNDAILASSDLKTVATSHRGDNYRFYNTATGLLVNSTPFHNCAAKIAFIDNDRFVTVKCGATSAVGIYSIYSGQLLQQLSLDNNISNSQVDFTSSSDGSVVGESYIAPSGNKKVWLWKLK